MLVMSYSRVTSLVAKHSCLGLLKRETCTDLVAKGEELSSFYNNFSETVYQFNGSLTFLYVRSTESCPDNQVAVGMWWTSSRSCCYSTL